MACILLILVGSSLAGCESSKGSKIDYPVVGPPPPRYTSNDVSYDDREYALTKTAPGTDIIKASSTSTEAGAAPELDIDMEVVAVVNGKPIIASEILGPYSAQLKAAKAKLPQEQFEIGRKQLIERELNTYVERVLLVQKLTETMKKEQIKALNEQVDSAFQDHHAKELMAAFKVNNTQELDEFMRANGTSLQQAKSEFGNQQLALFYMSQVVDKPRIVGHPEMEAYYKEHINEYKTPSRVKWQELSISYKKFGDKYSAAQEMKKAINSLKNGIPFEIVIKEFSDGATADQEGKWDWTQKESIADPDLSDMLFRMPVNKLSEVYEGEASFKIVRVLERESERITPFGEKQDEIRKLILAKDREDEVQKLLERLKADANIQTKYQILQNNNSNNKP